MGRLYQFGPLNLSVPDGILIVGVGVALFAIIETEKQIRLRATQQ
jgi:hypothetical protein